MVLTTIQSGLFSITLLSLALRQIGLMSNICQVIIRLPGFFILFSIIHFLSLFCDYQAALRLLLL
ncbi:hypothetical protein, partial [Aerococcus viridans]|uniref:hypothetical protein n=1 Tax=Aerococcus viridans TaxID=1377 RepID=UPI0039B0D907